MLSEQHLMVKNVNVLNRYKLYKETQTQSGVRHRGFLSPIIFPFLIDNVLLLAGGDRGVQSTTSSFHKHLDYVEGISLLSH